MDSRWSKTLGALKDTASIGFAKLGGSMSFIGIAVVKATEHNDTPPGEEHVAAILAATGSSRCRQRIKRAVKGRLSWTNDWKVAVKTLTLIHRLMRDASPSIFAEEDEKDDYSLEKQISFKESGFSDTSSPVAIDCSMWIRKYSSYLYYRLFCNKAFKCDIIRNRRKMKNLDDQAIFSGLRNMQTLMGKLIIDCLPRGSQVATKSLIHYALDLLVNEALELYEIIHHWIRRMVDSRLVSSMSIGDFYELDRRYLQFIRHYNRHLAFDRTCRRILPAHKIKFGYIKRPSDSLLDKTFAHHRKSVAIKKELTGMTKQSERTGCQETTEVVKPKVSNEEMLLITWCDSDDHDVRPCAITNCNSLMDLVTGNAAGSSKDTGYQREGIIINSDLEMKHNTQ